MKLPYLGVYNPMLMQLHQRFAGQGTGNCPPPVSPGSTIGSTRFQFQHAVPSILKGGEWMVQPLQMENAALTYEAYLTNPDAPVQRHGRGQSDAPYTWRDHMERVAKAEQEHQSHRQFSFAVLSSNTKKCLGCLHLTPLRPFLTRYQAPEHLLAAIGQNSAMILHWLCRSCREQPFAHQFIQTLHQWLIHDWELDEHLFRVQPTNVPAVHALQNAGLQQHFLLDVPVIPTQYAFYGA